MPRYFFDIKDGKRLVDPSGYQCANDEQAIAHAETIAARIAKDEGIQTQFIAVINDEGQEIAKVAIAH